jgi:hypothetical protein
MEDEERRRARAHRRLRLERRLRLSLWILGGAALLTVFVLLAHLAGFSPG